MRRLCVLYLPMHEQKRFRASRLRVSDTRSLSTGATMGRWDLKDMRAVITGGSKGLGLACVQEMLELGAHVLMTARGVEELQSVPWQIEPTWARKRARAHTHTTHKLTYRTTALRCRQRSRLSSQSSTRGACTSWRLT